MRPIPPQALPMRAYLLRPDPFRTERKRPEWRRQSHGATSAGDFGAAVGAIGDDWESGSLRIRILGTVDTASGPVAGQAEFADLEVHSDSRDAPHYSAHNGFNDESGYPWFTRQRCRSPSILLDFRVRTVELAPPSLLMNSSVNPPSEDFRAGLRPPQFNLRFLLLTVTACCILLATLRWLSPAAIVGVMLILFSIIAHVVGSALGAQLRDQGNQPLSEDLPPGLTPLGRPLRRATQQGLTAAARRPGLQDVSSNSAASAAVDTTIRSRGLHAAASQASDGSQSSEDGQSSEAALVSELGERSEADAIRRDETLGDTADFAPPSKLTRRESLGLVVYIAPLATSLALATAGGFWLRAVVGAKATIANIAFGVAAFGVLGCILGFLLGSFVKVMISANLDAWRNGESPP
jgi:hypothetical protein